MSYYYKVADEVKQISKLFHTFVNTLKYQKETVSVKDVFIIQIK